MSRIKKILIAVLVLFIAVIIVLLIRENILWNTGKLDTSNKMDQDAMIALLDKGATYPNYSYSSDANYGEVKTKTIVKDNKVSIYLDSKLIEKSDYNTGDTTNYWNINGETVEGQYNSPEISKHNQHGYDYSVVSDYEHFGQYEYEYIGETKEDGRTVILFQMNRPKEDSFNSGGVRFVVDKETGLILRRIDFSKCLFITTYQNNSNRNVEIDVTTDSD